MANNNTEILFGDPLPEFSYTGSGNINFHGCPEITIDYSFSIKFAVGSKVYDLISARKGILEAVAISKAWYVCDRLTLQKKVIYKDNNNWLHNEYDLGSHAEAIGIVDAFYNRKLNDINKAISLVNC